VTDTVPPGAPHATTLRWETTPLLYGEHAVAEIGFELERLGIRRALLVTDANLVATGLIDQLAAHAREAGAETVVWADSQLEPTAASITAAADALAGERYDGYIAVGGGSCIDTCKAVAVLLENDAELIAYVAPPHGKGRAVPRIRPIVAVTTTSGSGAEASGAASIEFDELGKKASIVDRSLRPASAVVDPLTTVTAPPAVTASAGYDVLVQSLESYTSRPFDSVAPRPAHKAPPMVGANPISDVWSERSIALCGCYLARAVADGEDLEARVGMAQAAMFSRLGTAGAHVPHANAAAVAALAPDTYFPAGFPGADRPVVPHGQAVVSTAAEAFAFTYAGAPERHQHAARLLGVAEEELAEAPERALTRWIRRLVEGTDGPTSLRALGFDSQAVPALAETAAGQRRLLWRSPRAVTEADLAEIFARSLDPVGDD
jgi:hydroxyacid-oxoacid transhydrogenase